MSRRWVVLGVVCAGIFLIFLDTTTMNVAIPNLIASIHAPFDQVLWVLNAYLLTYGVLLLTSGRLGEIWGQRNVFMVGLGVFSLASALCGLAQDGPQLIAARLLQGLGAALLTPQCLAILSRTFEPRERGLALGIFAAVGGLAAMAGAPAGGLIVASWGWRWIFFLNLPIGAATIALALVFVPSVKSGAARRLDLLGLALATGGLLAVMFGLIEGERFGWGRILGPITIPEVIAAGLALLLAVVVAERLMPEPLLPRSLFRNRNLMIMAWLSGAVAFALFGMLLVVIIDLQSALRMSPLEAGLTASPLTISTTLVSPFAGRLCDRIGSKPVLLFGLCLAAAGVIDLAISERATATWVDFLLPATVIGSGLGCVFAPLLTEALRDVPVEVLGSASGLLTTTRQVGSALGTALVGAVLQDRLTAALREQGNSFTDSYVMAMRPSLAVVAGALLLGAVTCLWIRRRAAVAEPAQKRILAPARETI